MVVFDVETFLLQSKRLPNYFAAWCIQLAALMLILASMYRALSINNLIVGISTGDISKQFGASVLIDGGFASLLMLLMGIWLLFLAPELRKCSAIARIQSILIGIAFSVFSAGFWWRYPSSFRMAAFLAIGLLILIPPIIFWKKNGVTKPPVS